MVYDRISASYPAFSIIIPCYNDGVYALAAIESCLQQTYAAHEIILIDDGSDDGSFDLVHAHYGHEIRVKVFRKTNGGLSSARNYGIDKAAGDFLVFLDADDKIAPGFLAAAAEVIAASAGSSKLLIISPFKYFPDNDEYGERAAKKKRLRPPLLTGMHLLDFLIVLASNRFPVSSCVVMRELISVAGYFDERMSSLEDWDYWIRVMACRPRVRYMAFVADACTQIRVRGGMMSNTARMRQSRDQIRAKHWHGLMGRLLRGRICSAMVRRFIRLLSALQRFDAKNRINLT